MKPIYIAIGANMSNPKAQLFGLPKRLNAHGVFVRQKSSLWQNPAWPKDMGYPDYLNGVFSVEFQGSADQLLAVLQQVEAEAGRIRTVRNAPRPLDLDILDFRGEQINDSQLILPHPRMNARSFVLLPLAEIAPHWHHPLTGLTALEVLAKLPASDIADMQFFAHMPPVD